MPIYGGLFRRYAPPTPQLDSAPLEAKEKTLKHPLLFVATAAFHEAFTNTFKHHFKLKAGVFLLS